MLWALLWLGVCGGCISLTEIPMALALGDWWKYTHGKNLALLGVAISILFEECSFLSLNN